MGEGRFGSGVWRSCARGHGLREPPVAAGRREARLRRTPRLHRSPGGQRRRARGRAGWRLRRRVGDVVRGGGRRGAEPAARGRRRRTGAQGATRASSSRGRRGSPLVHPTCPGRISGLRRSKVPRRDRSRPRQSRQDPDEHAVVRRTARPPLRRRGQRGPDLGRSKRGRAGVSIAEVVGPHVEQLIQRSQGQLVHPWTTEDPDRRIDRSTCGPPRTMTSGTTGPRVDHRSPRPRSLVVHVRRTKHHGLRIDRSTPGPAGTPVTGSTGPRLDHQAPWSLDRPVHAWTTKDHGHRIVRSTCGPPGIVTMGSTGPRVDPRGPRPQHRPVHLWTTKDHDLGIDRSTGGPAWTEVAGSSPPRVDHRVGRRRIGTSTCGPSSAAVPRSTSRWGEVWQRVTPRSTVPVVG